MNDIPTKKKEGDTCVQRVQNILALWAFELDSPKDWRAYGGYHVERSGETLCHRGETKHHSSLAAAQPLKVAEPEAMKFVRVVVAGAFPGGW